MTAAFAERLRGEREARGLSIGEVARLAALTPSAISRLEGHRRAPTRQTVRQLADAFRLWGETRDAFFLAAGYTPAEGWGLTPQDPVVGWLEALVAHPAMHDAAREAFLAPALRALGITAAGLLIRAGIAPEDLPPPPEGSGLSWEVVEHEMRFGIAVIEE